MRILWVIVGLLWETYDNCGFLIKNSRCKRSEFKFYVKIVGFCTAAIRNSKIEGNTKKRTQRCRENQYGLYDRIVGFQTCFVGKDVNLCVNRHRLWVSCGKTKENCEFLQDIVGFMCENPQKNH